jgi:hypothetical protein
VVSLQAGDDPLYEGKPPHAEVRRKQCQDTLSPALLSSPVKCWLHVVFHAVCQV